MGSPTVLVVAETPSLGRSVGQILSSSGIPCRVVQRVPAEEADPTPASVAPVIVVACNEPYCETARRWAEGAFPGFSLVVVGARDPRVAMLTGIHPIPLPLQPGALVDLVRSLLPGRMLPEPGDAT
jgi:hypothetical protein